MKSFVSVFSLLLFGAFFLSPGLIADEEAPLEPPPSVVYPPIEDFPRLGLPGLERLRWVGSLVDSIGFQTPVKSQGSRGTCSIFSATGMVEAIYKILDGKELDLSENYLQYLVMTRMKPVATEGSDTSTNIPAIRAYGDIFESEWPYEPSDWTSSNLSVEESKKVEETCGGLFGNRRQACLLSHLSPDDNKFADSANRFAQTYETGRLGYSILFTQSAVKDLLNRNYPVVLSLEFFYGAWNHRKMETYGIGARDMTKWGKGIVGTPTNNDIAISRQHPAGHSIVLVGYNDEQQIFYFKNSWGTTSFGVESDLLGVGTTAGYGSISYGYANRFGTFFDVYKTDDRGEIRRGRD